MPACGGCAIIGCQALRKVLGQAEGSGDHLGFHGSLGPFAQVLRFNSFLKCLHGAPAASGPNIDESRTLDLHLKQPLLEQTLHTSLPGEPDGEAAGPEARPRGRGCVQTHPNQDVR